jgi:hypothetical protein
MMGLYIPIAGLAALGIEKILKIFPPSRLLLICVYLLAIPSNLIVLATAIVGIMNHDSNIYLTMDEYESFEWIEDNTDPEALIISSPEMGLRIPAYTGRRVIYGHPYETVNAESEEHLVISFYEGRMSQLQMWEILRDRGIDYVYYGTRETKLGDIQSFFDCKPSFVDGDVKLFKINK